ncbi:Predicted oxidoreductase [Cnuella takakiae]|uniref:Predicted oxidoreductase n=1 Tax=Cnuella takakiae TaxID=1302690 RepID=A0A1M5GJI2_9BACT|nr:aldo/keto reductase [Cnuella takakiae]OLY92433.1 oxidoreductase [Cnuella takakiae]SHG03662.1 Predicted oxidoreductase [Cnuella takakiae]
MLLPLGRSGLQVSRIAFGCMSLKGNTEDNIALLQEAFEKGINLFDTADLYEQGANEELVGKAFREKRGEVVIATKVGNQWRPDGSGWDWNPKKAYILEAAEASLRRLQTDYIDLYQLHGGTIDDPTDETIEAFELLKQQGKIRAYGISSIRPNVVRRWVGHVGIDSLMVQYSLLDRRPEEDILDLAYSGNIGVLVRGALAQGLLLGKPPKPYLEYGELVVDRAAQEMAAVGTGSRTLTGTALQFVFKHPAVTSAVVGIRTPQQLQEALAALEEPPLDQESYSRLRGVAPGLTYQQHR